jgi:D-amino-acid dehydrogenase
MKVIVLGAGVVGVTTAYYLLKDGHQVMLIDRAEGVARECSHANGGFVAISQAVPWSAPGVPVKTLKTMAQPNAPILMHLSQLPRMWRWGLDFIRCSRAEPSWENTKRVLRLSLFSFEALKEIRADSGVDYDAVEGGALKVYSDQKSLDEAVAVSETQRPLGLAFRVLDGAFVLVKVSQALNAKFGSFTISFAAAGVLLLVGAMLSLSLRQAKVAVAKEATVPAAFEEEDLVLQKAD